MSRRPAPADQEHDERYERADYCKEEQDSQRHRNGPHPPVHSAHVVHRTVAHARGVALGCRLSAHDAAAQYERAAEQPFQRAEALLDRQHTPQMGTGASKSTRRNPHALLSRCSPRRWALHGLGRWLLPRAPPDCEREHDENERRGKNDGENRPRDALAAGAERGSVAGEHIVPEALDVLPLHGGICGTLPLGRREIVAGEQLEDRGSFRLGVRTSARAERQAIATPAETDEVVPESLRDRRSRLRIHLRPMCMVMVVFRMLLRECRQRHWQEQRA